MGSKNDAYKVELTEKGKLQFSELVLAREKFHRRYPTIWHVPLVKKQTQVLGRLLRDGMSVLDVGAGSRGAEHRIKGLGISIRYKSMDVDKNLQHDFYDLANVDETFDVILLSQVIEHITPAEGFTLLTTLRHKLRNEGFILVSTPNIFHPNRFFTTVDHKSFYAYDELAGILDTAEFKVDGIFRIFNDSFLQYILKAYAFHFLFRFLSIDYAYSIVLVARKVASRATD